MKYGAWVLGVAMMTAMPALALEQKSTVPLVDLQQAPISPSQLTEGKKEDVAILILRAAKRENVAATQFNDVLTRQKARDAALIGMLGPDSAITVAFAKALEEKLGGFLANNVAPENVHAIALQMVQSIFLNRRDDLLSTQNLYNDAAWQKTMRERLKKGDIPELNVTLKPEKREELKNTALYVYMPGKPEGKIEPAVHLILTALAQQIGHAALADITHEGTPVHTMFMDAMENALPKDTAAKAWLNDWLYLRAGRAQAVAQDFRPDGALMQDAVAQSETTRRKRMQNPPAIAYRD